MATIVTGVDRLMNLIKDKKKVSVDQAASELGVSRSILLEWANFLEQDGSIDIDDRLLHSYLVFKSLPTKESKKVSYQSVMKGNQSGNIKDFEKKIKALKAEMNMRIGNMEKELRELKSIEMLNQEAIQKGVHNVDKKLIDEKKILQRFNREILDEKKELRFDKSAIQDLKKGESLIEKKLETIDHKLQAMPAQPQPTYDRKALVRQLDLYRDKIRKLNYEKAMALANNRLAEVNALEATIQKYKKAYYDIATRLGNR